MKIAELTVKRHTDDLHIVKRLVCHDVEGLAYVLDQMVVYLGIYRYININVTQGILHDSNLNRLVCVHGAIVSIAKFWKDQSIIIAL